MYYCTILILAEKFLCNFFRFSQKYKYKSKNQNCVVINFGEKGTIFVKKKDA